MKMIKLNMYGRMNDAHGEDKKALDHQIEEILKCNADIVELQSPTGTLGVLQKAATEAQHELNRLNEIVEAKAEVNRTKWDEFWTHMSLIQTPPICPALPARTMPTLDMYFEKSEYSIWFTAQQSRYFTVRDAWLAAHAALKEALAAYNIQKAKLDVHYCDWKKELEAACARFDLCWSTRVDYYKNDLIPRVSSSMHRREAAFKAGQTLIHQIEFLLALKDSSETGEIDASLYRITFAAVPQKALCDTSPLTSDTWNPPIKCLQVTDFVEGVPVAEGETIRASCSGYDPTQAHGGTVHVNFFGADGSIILTFAPRWGNRKFANGMKTDHVVRNSKLAGQHWGSEERGGGWPLGTIGSAFVIDFVRTETEWKVSINGEPAHEFNYAHRTSEPVTKVLVRTDGDGDGVSDARVQLLHFA